MVGPVKQQQRRPAFAKPVKFASQSQRAGKVQPMMGGPPPGMAMSQAQIAQAQAQQQEDYNLTADDARFLFGDDEHPINPGPPNYPPPPPPQEIAVQQQEVEQAAANFTAAATPGAPLPPALNSGTPETDDQQAIQTGMELGKLLEDYAKRIPSVAKLAKVVDTSYHPAFKKFINAWGEKKVKLPASWTPTVCGNLLTAVSTARASFREYGKKKDDSRQLSTDEKHLASSVLTKLRTRFLSEDAFNAAMSRTNENDPELARALILRRQAGAVHPGYYAPKTYVQTGTEEGIERFGKTVGTATNEQLRARAMSGYHGYGAYTSDGYEGSGGYYSDIIAGALADAISAKSKPLGMIARKLLPHILAELETRVRDYFGNPSSNEETVAAAAAVNPNAHPHEVVRGVASNTLDTLVQDPMKRNRNERNESWQDSMARTGLAWPELYSGSGVYQTRSNGDGDMTYSLVQDPSRFDTKQDYHPQGFNVATGGSLRVNQIIDPGADYSRRPPSMMSTDDETGDLVFSHREYLTDVTPTSADFQTFQNFALNPGLKDTFPLLAQFAQYFETYQFEQLIFRFRSIVTPGNGTAGGTVMLATCYNSMSAQFSSKRALENSEYSISGKVTDDIRMGIECEAKKNALGGPLYIRYGEIPNNQSLQTYDMGFVQICTQGASVSPVQDIGEIWVDYRVRLGKLRAVAQLPIQVGEGTSLAVEYPINEVAVANAPTCTGLPFNPLVTSAMNLGTSGLLINPITITNGALPGWERSASNGIANGGDAYLSTSPDGTWVAGVQYTQSSNLVTRVGRFANDNGAYLQFEFNAVPYGTYVFNTAASYYIPAGSTLPCPDSVAPAGAIYGSLTSTVTGSATQNRNIATYSVDTATTMGTAWPTPSLALEDAVANYSTSVVYTANNVGGTVKINIRFNSQAQPINWAMLPGYGQPNPADIWRVASFSYSFVRIA